MGCHAHHFLVFLEEHIWHFLTVKFVFTFSMESFFRSVENHFSLGEHFAENVIDQREVDSVYTYVPETKCLKTVHVDKKGIESVIERTMEGDTQNVVFRCDLFKTLDTMLIYFTLPPFRCKDVICTNIWKKTKGLQPKSNWTLKGGVRFPR